MGLSWANTRIEAVANRLHLKELQDALSLRVAAGKKYLLEIRGSTSKKVVALRERVIVIIDTVAGKTYSVVAGVVGKERVDCVLEIMIKYSPLRKNGANKTSGVSEKKNQ